MIGLWLSAGAAQAQEPGVVVDPNSPAGTEYALPLNDARNSGSHGSSGSQAAAPADKGSSLFGVGIKPSKTNPGNSGAGSGTGRKRHRGRSSEAGLPAIPLVRQPQRPSVAAVPQAGAGTSLMVTGSAAIVVLAGTLLGLLVRRRRAGDPRD
jgi:hypothetical protein